MAVGIAELFVTVGADISGALGGLNTLSGQITRFGNQVQTAGRNVTKGITVPIVGAAAAVFAAGSDFEASFTQVKRTVDDLDPSQLADLRKELLRMSTTSEGGLKTASELADIASVGGQLGLTGNEIKTFTSLVARLSLATNLPFGEIAEDVGRSLKIMNLAEGDYERFGSTVAVLGNVMGGTERDIFEFSRRLAATLGALGVKPQQILAISAALAEAGVNPEAGATAINKFFVEMTDSLNETSGASEEAKQKLQSLKSTISDLSGNLEVASLRQKEFGRNTPASVVKANQLAIDKYKRELGDANTKLDQFSQTSAQGKLSIGGMAKVAGISEDAFRALVKTDPATAFASFVAGLQEIASAGGPEALTKTLGDLGITEERQREALLALAKSSKSLPKALNAADTAWGDQKGLITEVDKAMADLKNQIKLVANTMQVELIGAFDKQRDSIQALIDETNKFLPILKSITGLIPTLTPDQLKAIGLIAAIGPGLIGLGIIFSAIGAIVGVLGSPVVLAVLGAILAIGGIAFVFDQIANHWDALKSSLGDKSIFQPAIDAIDTFKQHGEEIKGVLANIGTFDLPRALASTFATAGVILGAFGEFLSKFFDSVILPIFLRFAGWVTEHILGAIIGILEFMQKLGITSLPGIADVGATIADLKANQAGAAAAAGGTDVTVTINNPVVTSQSLLDEMIAKTQAAITQGLVLAERSVIIPPQPLPGQVPGTPF